MTDFDWNPLGEAWWRDTAQQLGASDKQTKFAAAKHRGCSNTEAARQAGYTASNEGGLRTQGYRLARANIIEKLLAFASGEGGGYNGSVDRAEARRILSSLARGSDPSVRIRAIEQLAKFDDAQRPAEPEPMSSEQVVRELLKNSPEYGPAIAADAWISDGAFLLNMPYIAKMAPRLKRDFPLAWPRYRASVGAHWYAKLDEWADGPVLSNAEIIGPEPIKNKSDEETQ